MTYFDRKAAVLAIALGGASLFGAAAPASAQSLFNTTPAPAVEAAEGAAVEAAGAATTAARRAVTTRKPAAKKPAGRNAAKVNIVNKRGSTLVELAVVSKASATAQPQMVASGLLAGKRKTSNLARNGGCIYDISGAFDDESNIEVSGFDLCKDPTINLVE